MAAQKKEFMTIAEIMAAKEGELLESWLENVKALPGTRTLELVTEAQLRTEAAELLRTLVIALGSEEYEDITRPEFADSLALLRDISASRAEQGFTPSETAFFVLSLKNALLAFLQQEFADDPAQLNAEMLKMGTVLDNLGLVTFETYVLAREEVIAQQSCSIIELTTPVVRLWDEIVVLPLMGVIDTLRAQKITESLLRAITKIEARVAIIDVTGVPVIDTRVAQYLIDAMTAARMVGAEVIITGVSTDAAQTLVRLRVDLSPLRTKGSLRTGFAEALKLVGQRITPT